MPTRLWIYRARAERVVDGDTIDVTIDAGFRGYRIERLRLLDVDTPETKGVTRAAGLTSQLFVADWVQAARLEGAEWPLVVQTQKSDAFGRFLGRVWRTSDGACLNSDLITSGHAVPFMVEP